MSNAGPNSGPPAIRPLFFVVIGGLVILLIALIRNSTAHKPVANEVPASDARSNVMLPVIEVSNAPTATSSNRLEVNATSNPMPPPVTISSHEIELRKQVADLENEISNLQAQITAMPTNSMPVLTNGTWSCVVTDSCGPLTKRVTVVSGDAGTTIHVVEMDHCQTMDWGEAPLISVGAPFPGQSVPPYPTGFAMFSGNANEGGFQYGHRLMLIVTFEPEGIWTMWGRSILNTSYDVAPQWRTHLMILAN